MSKRNNKTFYGETVQRENRISFKDNPEQQEFIRLINSKKSSVIFCTGNAGTGKTFSAIYTAYELVRKKQYSKIIFSRNPVQLGEDMGYLPGDVGEKFGPFMACLYDNLENIERLGGPLQTDMISKIEVTPIAFLRGRSIEDAIIILDEAQNLDLITLKAILTRAGEYCKIILCGSLNQIDEPKQARKEKCDFVRVMEALEEFDFVAHIELIQSKRSKICALIDDKLKDLK